MRSHFDKSLIQTKQTFKERKKKLPFTTYTPTPSFSPLKQLARMKKKERPCIELQIPMLNNKKKPITETQTPK